MAGRRLLDAAKLFNASKGVARQHLKLRSEQYDAYTKTSTLAKVVKDQTDRITLTLEAYAALARRMNEAPPNYTACSTSDIKEDDGIPNKGTIQGEKEFGKPREGLAQDHHWERSQENATDNEQPREELNVTQEQAKRYPLPDGTIPPAGADLPGRPFGKDIFNKRPTPEPYKDPLAEESARQNEELQPVSSGTSTIPTPLRSSPLEPDHARTAQRQSENQIPALSAETQAPSQADHELSQDHDKDVFYSRSTTIEQDYSSLPRLKIPKSFEQGPSPSDEIASRDINSDVFHRPTGSSAKEELPEGVDTAVFRTSKVAEMLGGKTHDKSSPYQSNPYRAKEVENRSRASTTSERQRRPVVDEDEMRAFASDLAQDSHDAQDSAPEEHLQANKRYHLRESTVPSTRFGRLWQYGGLATSMAFGAVGESLRRITGSGTDGGSLMLSPANMERLVTKLSRMRGAALKLGQMISFQDLKMLPAPIHEVLQRVQDSADYMPASQRNKVLAENLGADWEALFRSFDDVPIAAASIGQVHRATLASNGKEVAVKVQYPGVANSIDSDLNNLSILLTASRLLPKGLYLDKTIANARTELAWETDYVREADYQMRFKALLADDTESFRVPTVYKEASGAQVLTADLMSGTAVTKQPNLSQSQRNWIGTQILRLCLREIVEFRVMQTDPNWTNFLYNAESEKLELLDFGASRDYPRKFTDPYINILINASKNNRKGVRDLSIELGYLTGHESKTMLDAHIDSVLTLAEPFSESGPEVYDFRDQTITDRVRSLIPIMVRERLAPPPEETYSLHRKLSGAFLLCSRLGSQVPCRALFTKAVETFRYGGGITDV
ncbi:ABC1-domain-containing protein [Pseudovirgaria hyperparasitica]|uniref:ABC1-domain-containing protein n=1 Tax=Pseudovirgaria hyperparasitica TaxID=470096 RepID=A0A6A6W1X2_9PEZI|nr:ABC1-domain-containing protein [Pseudovirgaria hyperparasitica]KAF2755940.1 ABC1-domain-containing protein [Pseudovirgaria hyperparasitica]